MCRKVKVLEGKYKPSPTDTCKYTQIHVVSRKGQPTHTALRGCFYDVLICMDQH